MHSGKKSRMSMKLHTSLWGILMMVYLKRLRLVMSPRMLGDAMLTVYS